MISLPFHQNRSVSAHIAHAGHAISDEKRQEDVASPRKPIAKGGMHMHVPKSGNKILAGGINHARILRQLKFCRIRNRGDVIAGDDHGLICVNR